jgi:glycine/D-amino acid oxidase-like deaminating enzyme
MNIVSGKRIWIETSNIPNKYTYLSQNTECDVVIVGAGVIGAICAYYFSMAGIKTIILDRNIIGYSSTSASTSLLQYEVDTDLTGLKSMIGMENAVLSFKLFEKAVFDIQNIIDGFSEKCGFCQRESLYYTNKAVDADNLKEEFNLRKNNGFDVEFIDKQKAKQLFSFDIEAGILSKSGAGEINPYAFAHELINASVKKGLEVFENSEVTAIKQQADHMIVETNKNKWIKCKKVLISTGYEGVNYINEKIATFTRTFIIATRPVQLFDGWFNRCLIRDNLQTYTYFRTTADNRILVGGEDENLGGERSKISQLNNMESFLENKYSTLENKLKSFFPQIKDIEVEYKFNGVFGVTSDGLPYIGEHPDHPNTFFCLSYGSNGILYGIVGAQMLRDLYLGEVRKELKLFRFGR